MRKRPGRVKDQKQKEEENAMIQKSIELSSKINKNDIVNSHDLGMKNTLFFRVHVSGIIESANVFIILINKISFLKEMLYIVNMTLYMELIGKKKRYVIIK
jgi:hypothetical protein